MSEPDPKTTLREFKEYVDLSYEPASTMASTRKITWRFPKEKLGLTVAVRAPDYEPSPDDVRQFLIYANGLVDDLTGFE